MNLRNGVFNLGEETGMGKHKGDETSLGLTVRSRNLGFRLFGYRGGPLALSLSYLLLSPPPFPSLVPFFFSSLVCAIEVERDVNETGECP